MNKETGLNIIAIFAEWNALANEKYSRLIQKKLCELCVKII